MTPQDIAAAINALSAPSQHALDLYTQYAFLDALACEVLAALLLATAAFCWRLRSKNEGRYDDFPWEVPCAICGLIGLLLLIGAFPQVVAPEAYGFHAFVKDLF